MWGEVGRATPTSGKQPHVCWSLSVCSGWIGAARLPLQPAEPPLAACGRQEGAAPRGAPSSSIRPTSRAQDLCSSPALGGRETSPACQVIVEGSRVWGPALVWASPEREELGTCCAETTASSPGHFQTRLFWWHQGHCGPPQALQSPEASQARRQELCSCFLCK